MLFCELTPGIAFAGFFAKLLLTAEYFGSGQEKSPFSKLEEEIK